MRILSIDPGSHKSGYVIWNGEDALTPGVIDNNDMLSLLQEELPQLNKLVIENIASYGRPVGRTVFDTCIWIGRYIQLWLDKARTLDEVFLIERKEVKLHLCGRTSSKDSDVIKAIKERYGEKGTKKQQGFTYNLSGDSWQAFALAVYWFDKLY
jgi:hypothetical protein